MALAEVKMPPFTRGKKQLEKVDLIGVVNSRAFMLNGSSG